MRERTIGGSNSDPNPVYEVVDRFKQAISDAGITPPDHIEPDGKIHRFSTNEHAGDAAGWYVLHLDQIPAGAFCCWRSDVNEKWCYKSLDSMTKQEKRDYDQTVKTITSQRKKEKEGRQAEARKEAERIWNLAKDVASHPYLSRKGVEAHGVREHEGRIVIPVQDASGSLHSLQYIDQKGNKRFLTGGAKSGHFFLIGKPNGTLLLCEGFATGAALHEATGHAVVVAFDAGNLNPVAKQLFSKYPDIVIVVCGDNDARTENNIGADKAKAAAQAVGGLFVVPEFKDTTSKPTNFNDLATQEGLEAVQKIIDAVLVGNVKPNKEQLPPGFTLNQGGLFYQSQDDDQKQKICSPLEISARTSNDVGEDHGRLLEFDDSEGRHHSWAMPMEMLAGDGTDYRRVLLSKGLHIQPGQKARNSLSVYIQTAHVDQTALCVGKTGWHNGAYVFPDATLGEKDKRILLQTQSIETNTFSQAGSLEDWKNTVGTYCRNNSRLMFAVSVSFAAPLLEFTDDESGGFNFQGQSSTGKTTALIAAASVYGGKNYLNRWRATSNGLEGMAALHNDALLILDELAQVDPKGSRLDCVYVGERYGKS